MVGEYRRQVRDQVAQAPNPVPGASRDGIAEGLQALGGALGHVADSNARTNEALAQSEFRIAEEEKRRRQSHAAAVFAGDSANAEADLRLRLQELRTRSKPGAYDHAEKAGDVITEAGQKLLDRIADDPELYDRLAPSVVRMTAQARMQEEGWALDQRVDYEAAQFGKHATAEDNRMYGAFDPAMLDASIASSEAIINELDAPGTRKAALMESVRHDRVTAMLDGAIDRGEAEKVRAALDSGILDAIVPADEKSRYLKRADGIFEERQRDAESAANEAKSGVRDQVKALEAKIRAGIAPTSAEIRAVRQQAAAAGLDAAEQIDIGAMEVRADATRYYGQFDTLTLRRKRDWLAQRRAAGQASEREQVSLTVAEDMIETRTRAQAEQVKALMGQGIAGQAQAIASIEGDAENRFAVAEQVRQGWGVLTGLGPRAVEHALEGAELLKARPKDFGEREQIDRAFADLAGMPGHLLPTAHYQAIRDTAFAIYAADRNANGKVGFDPVAFRGAVQVATGARRQADGRVTGGVDVVRGRAVQLPDRMTAQDFDTWLARQDFAGVRYPNGDAVRKADILANFRPEFIGDDERGRPVYRFVDARNLPLRVGSRDYLLAVPQ